ncbi:UNVERIFIED_CONTAM: hypothetical protein HDU68_003872 [Siphonaria sp. JEL0065]|nr:hypothetical protein HDU68_003872 [Siphonaria sp. JEL0065]
MSTPTNLLRSTPSFLEPSKLMEELKIHASDSTVERPPMMSNENKLPASDGKIQQNMRKRMSNGEEASINKKLKQHADENKIGSGENKNPRRSDLAKGAALAGKNILGPV